MIKKQNKENTTPSRVLAGYQDNHTRRTETIEPGQNRFAAVNFTPNEVSKVLLMRISLDEIRGKPITLTRK
jgi:hypothetical protein